MNRRDRKPDTKVKAQTIVEFALILPLLLLVLLGVIEFGRILFIYVTVTSTSREGARYGSAVGAQTVNGLPRYLDCDGMRSAALKVGILANLTPSNITVSYDHGPDTASSPYIADCTASPANLNIGNPQPPNPRLGDRVVVNVATTIQPLFSYVIAKTFTIQAQTARTIIKDVNVGAAVLPQPGPPSTFNANLSVTKTDYTSSVMPGSSDTYSIIFSNTGPDDSPGVAISDYFPPEFTSPTWTCSATGGATCPAASGSGVINATVSLPAGSKLTFLATGIINASATGSLINTATITPPSSVNDPDLTNNTATDTDEITTQADLFVTKTDGVDMVAPGQTVTYTVMYGSNPGSVSVTGATISDNFPAILKNVSWRCTESGGATCPAATGTGNINATVNFPSNGNLVFLASGMIDPSATGNLANTATIAVPPGIVDPIPGNNSATDIDTLSPQADLYVTKTDGIKTILPGDSNTYTIVFGNTGPSDAPAVTLVDNFSPLFTNVIWTCEGVGGAVCPAATGKGDINAVVSLPVGSTITYHATSTLSLTAAGTLVNTATITPGGGLPDPDTTNNSATDTDLIASTPDLFVTLTDGTNNVTPGLPLNYTIVFGNNGPINADGATLADAFPAVLNGVSWVCTGAGGAVCPAASGTGSINTTASFPINGTLTYQVSALLDHSASGELVNTATIAPPAPMIDPLLANNTASDTDQIVPQGDLSITKSDGQYTVSAGHTVTYTIQVGNAGPSDISGAVVTDLYPSMLSNGYWLCTGSGGASCSASSGTGSLNATANLPAGSSVIFHAIGTVDLSATGTLLNTATVAPPVGAIDPNEANNTATDSDTVTPACNTYIAATSFKQSGKKVSWDITNNGPSINITRIDITFDNGLAVSTISLSGTPIWMGSQSSPASMLFTAPGPVVAANSTQTLQFDFDAIGNFFAPTVTFQQCGSISPK